MVKTATIKKSTRHDNSALSQASKKVIRAEVMKDIRGVLQTEVKEENNVQTVNLYGGTTTNGSYMYLLNGMVTGTDSVSSRVGRTIKHASVQVRSYFYNTTSINGGLGDAGFMAIVLDRNSNGAQPLFSDIFDTASTTIPGLSVRSTLINRERFRILKIVDYVIGDTQGGASPVMLNFYINLARILKGHDETVKYNGTGSAVSNISSGALYLVMGQCNPGATGVCTSGSWMAKYRYTDV